MQESSVDSLQGYRDSGPESDCHADGGCQRS